MGLARVMVRASSTAASTAMSRTFTQEIPEKDPWDQLWRLAMLASSAKVTKKSVTAEQM